MGEKIVLTTCTAAYLAQAKTLGDSLIQHNPGYRFVIGMVDRIDGRVDGKYWSPHELIEVHTLGIPQFEQMYRQYSTLELVCALKSFYSAHLLKKYNPELLIFLDADIMVFDSLSVIESALAQHSILLTPHINQPFPIDGKRPSEKVILKTGMFNAGFYALRNDDTGNRFIDWWKVRMVDQAYERPKEGLNVDQKWLNFLPIYFEKVGILKHPGCNLAYWNFHERQLSVKEDKFYANDQPVIFFHYSGYSLQQPGLISRHQDRFQMNDNPAFGKILEVCRQTLLKNDDERLQKIPCVYRKTPKGLLQKLGLKKR